MKKPTVLFCITAAVFIAVIQSCATTPPPAKPVTLGDELIVDGDFDSGLTKWSPFMMNDASATFEATDGGVRISIIKVPRKSSGDIQLTQPKPGFAIQKGRTYRLRFDAISSAGTSLTFTIDENGNDINKDGFAYSAHAVGQFQLRSSVATFEKDLTVNADNPSAGIIFLLGRSTGEITIAHVSLREIL
jgi:hypothetical protein